ncbi:hypothetical protein HY029_01590 [Candidatus Gottesmanbacteria bacterium]|nr:hypothetical protein [Candidatus Gottesmanbacteria bacterium]
MSENIVAFDVNQTQAVTNSRGTKVLMVVLFLIYAALIFTTISGGIFYFIYKEIYERDRKDLLEMVQQKVAIIESLYGAIGTIDNSMPDCLVKGRFYYPYKLGKLCQSEKREISCKYTDLSLVSLKELNPYLESVISELLNCQTESAKSRNEMTL